MVNYLKVIGGSLSFFLAYFLVIILQYVIPPLIDLMQSAFGNEIAGILWFGLILIWALALVAMPIAITVWGLTENNETEETSPVVSYLIAVLYFIFSLALFYFTWYMVAPMKDVILYPLLAGMFWMGLISIWIINVVVVPSYLVIEAKRG